MPGKIIKDFLDSNNVPYFFVEHSPAYTAQDIAEKTHISGKNIAKTVILKIKDIFYMAVLPANYKISLILLKDIFKSDNIYLAEEEEFYNKFPDCEIGAMPPFGNLYDMPVIVTKELTRDEDISFNACTHSELLTIKYGDYKKLVSPRVLDFGII